MTRREIREQIFKILFAVEFYDTADRLNQLELYKYEEAVWDEAAWSDADEAYITGKLGRITELLPEIDEAINKVAEGWKTNRMGKVDLTLLRLAVYEMKYEEDIPFKVAINEAVELAKKYGTDDTPSFVNGILGKLV